MIEGFSTIVYIIMGFGILMFFVAFFIFFKNFFTISKTHHIHQNLTQQMNEMISENNDGLKKVTTTKHVKKTIYKNGEIVSEEETTTHNNISSLTNCPNCGAKINDTSKTNCEYCHTALK